MDVVSLECLNLEIDGVHGHNIRGLDQIDEYDQHLVTKFTKLARCDQCVVNDIERSQEFRRDRRSEFVRR